MGRYRVGWVTTVPNDVAIGDIYSIARHGGFWKMAGVGAVQIVTGFCVIPNTPFSTLITTSTAVTVISRGFVHLVGSARCRSLLSENLR